MYGDRDTTWVFDDQGVPLLPFPRSSGTVLEYPVVADTDNDGSPEILPPLRLDQHDRGSCTGIPRT